MKQQDQVKERVRVHGIFFNVLILYVVTTSHTPRCCTNSFWSIILQYAFPLAMRYIHILIGKWNKTHIIFYLIVLCEAWNSREKKTNDLKYQASALYILWDLQCSIQCQDEIAKPIVENSSRNNNNEKQNNKINESQ